MIDLKTIWLSRIVLVGIAVAASLGPLTSSTSAAAGPCKLAATATLYGAGDVASVAGQGNSDCSTHGSTVVKASSRQPYFTFEIVCSTERQAAAEGLCSTTPCPDFGRFFAFRILHRPDGTTVAAGFECVSLEQAVANPGLTVADVFEAVRG